MPFLSENLFSVLCDWDVEQRSQAPRETLRSGIEALKNGHMFVCVPLNFICFNNHTRLLSYPILDENVSKCF